MFKIIKKMFIRWLIGLVNGLSTDLVNGSNNEKCLSLSNQKCEIQPTTTNLHPNESS